MRKIVIKVEFEVPEESVVNARKVKDRLEYDFGVEEEVGPWPLSYGDIRICCSNVRIDVEDELK